MKCWQWSSVREAILRESDEVVLVNDVEQPSVLVEAGGDQVGGSAEGEGEQGVLLEGITSDVPRPKLVQATEVDPTLATARSLAVSLPLPRGHTIPY